jgi:hypothetical protein
MKLTAMTVIIEQPAVVRADSLAGAVEASAQEDLEERRDEHACLAEGRCGGGLEGLVQRRRAPAAVASPADGGSR